MTSHNNNNTGRRKTSHVEGNKDKKTSPNMIVEVVDVHYS